MPLEMPIVRALAITLSGLHELVASDPTVLGDLLHDRDRQTLRTRHYTHELPVSNRLSIVPVSNHAWPRPNERMHIQAAHAQAHASQIRSDNI